MSLHSDNVCNNSAIVAFKYIVIAVTKLIIASEVWLVIVRMAMPTLVLSLFDW